MPRVGQGNCEPFDRYRLGPFVSKAAHGPNSKEGSNSGDEWTDKTRMVSLKDGRVVSGGSVDWTIGDRPRCVGQSRIQRAWWIQGLGYHSEQNDRLSEKKEDRDSHGKDGRPGRVDEHAGMFCSAFEKQGNQAPGMGSRIKLGRFCRLGKQPPIARKQTCWAGQRRPSQRSETCSVWPHGAGRRAVHCGRPRRRPPPPNRGAGRRASNMRPWPASASHC